MVAQKSQSRLIASLDYRSRFFAGTLAFIDAAKSSVLAFVPVGSDPGPLVLGDDGSTAAVGLNSTGLVVPFNAGTFSLGTAYAVGTAADGRNLQANEMAAAPGQPTLLAVARRGMNGAAAGTALYQNAALVGTATAAGVGDVHVTFGSDATQVFGHNGTNLVRMSAGAGGLSVQATSGSLVVGNGLRYAGGKLVCGNGSILNPADFTQTGLLGGSYNSYAVCAEPTHGRIYACTYSLVAAYDTVAYAQTGSISAYSNDYGNYHALVRWGGTGLAYADSTTVYSYNDEFDSFVTPPAVTVVLPGSIAENAGTLSGGGSVQIQDALTSNLTVNLQSTDSVQLQVPASVTILAGQLSATFNVSVADDSILNGARSVSVIPSGTAGYAYQTGSTLVTDNETTTVSLSAPTTLVEGAGLVSGPVVVSLGSAVGADVTIQLTSSDTTLITVPATVVIPYGTTSAVVPLTVLDDGYIRGTKNVVVTATETGWNAAAKSIAITDVESATLTVSYDSPTVSEATYYTGASIILGGKVDAPLTVNLTCDVPSRLTVPASVTIPAGSSSVYFSALPFNNTLTDGRRTVTTTATAIGFVTGTASIVVIDDDVGAFTWTIPPNVVAGMLLNITVTPTSIDGDPTGMNSSPTWNLAAARNGSAIALAAMTPLATSYPYTSANGTATINSAGANTVLSFVYNGTTYTSPAFAIAPGPQAGFAWGAINPSGPQPNVAFPVTLTAADSYGNAISAFTGTAALTATQSATSVTVGTGTDTYVPLIATAYNLNRNQTVYLASEVGAAGSIRTLAVQVSQAPGQAFDAFTVRAKHTTLTTPDTSSGWDNTGWTTLKQGALNLGQATGWVVIHLDTPFSYNGTSNLALDISYSNATATSGGTCYSTSNSGQTYSALGNSGNGYGDPLTWTSGYNTPTPSQINSRPNLRFGFGNALSMTPTTTGSFVNGAWSGNVTLPTTANSVFLTAHSGVYYGDSNLFDVGAVPPAAPVLSALPAYATGTSASTAWSTVTATDYYIEAATDNTFASPVANSGWITATSYVFTGLTDGTHYYYHVRGRKGTLLGPWSNTVDSTFDNVGPKIYLSALDDTAITNFTTTRNPVLIQGHLTDTSGIASFAIISGGTSYPWTVNADGTWSVSLTTPSAGSYSLGFYGVDKATATANTTTRNLFVTRIADTDSNGLPDDWQTGNGLPLNGANTAQTADFDHDGRPNLLEYALNTPPNSSSGNAMPNATNEVKSADGKTYLVFRYDRRRGALDLTYSLEFSTDLATWSATSQQTELTAPPTLNADNTTERVVTRVLPDVSQFAGHKVFVRLKVVSSAP
jgi:hypothetical protein